MPYGVDEVFVRSILQGLRKEIMLVPGCGDCISANESGRRVNETTPVLASEQEIETL